MTISQTSYSSFLKTISPVLSNTIFNKIVKGEEEVVKKRALKYLSYNSTVELSTYKDFFEHLYESMLKNYRSEFIYKNEIVNKILLGRYSLNTATVLNEFRVGRSIADLVMLNGTSIVYEIKTEYDSPERLLSQINEYRKSFLKIVIVTHYTVARKYEAFLLEHRLDNIGLIVFSNRSTLKEKIKPIEDSSFLDVTYMFKCLRKDEYTRLIKKYYGYLPNVPNTKLFKECLELAKKIEEKDFHDLMFNYLKKRTIKEKKIVSSQEIPVFLKHISICLNFKKKELEKIHLFLNKNL
ncbi:sce7726 family protein [Tenacibaculum sp.]|uniref:sce7726 family protein n=1 Tax=Tenacibaculum sp. TaxID=1906242 RepID=UPI003AA9AD61